MAQALSEGMTLVTEMLSCGDGGAVIDNVIDDVIAGLPEGIDGDCVRDAIEGADLSQVASGESQELANAMTECVTAG